VNKTDSFSKQIAEERTFGGIFQLSIAGWLLLMATVLALGWQAYNETPERADVHVELAAEALAPFAAFLRFAAGIIVRFARTEISPSTLLIAPM
jgi:hypothetical protein